MSEPRRGDAKVEGSAGMPPQKILAEFDRILEAFCAF